MRRSHGTLRGITSGRNVLPLRIRESAQVRQRCLYGINPVNIKLDELWAAVLHGLETASGRNVDDDDSGMRHAVTPDLLLWVEDLQDRVGLHVGEMRKAVFNYSNARDRARILEEFPDYDGADDLPDYAALGFACNAWHNDACPQFNTLHTSETDFSCWSLFIDYKDPALRELGPDSGRFTLGRIRPCGGYDQDSYNGDDWAEVVRLVTA